MNDAPTELKLTPNRLTERVSGAKVGTVSALDQDIGQLVTFTTTDSRFEIRNGELRLKAGQFLELNSGTTTVEIVATDSGSPPRVTHRTIEVTIQENVKPWQNESEQLDVDRDGSVVPLDVLLVINELNAPTVLGANGELPRSRPTGTDVKFLDINGDGFCTAIDALQIINALNARSAEGEASAWGVSTRPMSVAQAVDVVFANEDEVDSAVHTSPRSREVPRLAVRLPRKPSRKFYALAQVPVSPEAAELLFDELDDESIRDWINP